ncbi:MAG: hypothetical protein HY906_10565 [Deltaproteobacteria bacterium]|nr:hypothetical protein [Deltaproteobacteria bacterium]
MRKSRLATLSAVVIDIPPLRERREDIAPLVQRLLVRARQALGKEVAVVAPAAVELLCAHDWPGNVRQLARTLELATVACPGQVILPEHLTIK